MKTDKYIKKTKYWKIIYFLPNILHTNVEHIIGNYAKYINNSVFYNQSFELILTKKEIKDIQETHTISSLLGNDKWYLEEEWLGKNNEGDK